MSGSLGFNRLGLMAGLMSPVELPELSNLLTDDIIAIKVGLEVPSYVLSLFMSMDLEAPFVSTKALIISL